MSVSVTVSLSFISDPVTGLLTVSLSLCLCLSRFLVYNAITGLIVSLCLRLSRSLVYNTHYNRAVRVSLSVCVSLALSFITL